MTRPKLPRFETIIEQDRLDRTIVRFPKTLHQHAGKKFVFKVVGEQLRLLPKPVRSQQLLRLNLARWKLRHG